MEKLSFSLKLFSGHFYNKILHQDCPRSLPYDIMTKQTVILTDTLLCILGIGFGISYTGNIAAVNSHFDKYRTLATGTISIGIVFYKII